MENIIDKKSCTGCTSCLSVCPKKAISFKEDSDGFKFPVIDKDKCIDCGLCKKKCPVLNTKDNDSINDCYVGFNYDDNEKLKSSSGAIFSLLADYVLDNNGIVIGAAFDKDNKLKHVAVESKKDLDKLKGSKYLQSDLNNIFTYIKENIKDRKILFVGTPCQVAGVKAIINNKNLLCVDLICHGVPSPKLFDKYIKELESKNNDSLLNYNFRDKSTGWDTYSNTASFKNNNISELSKNNKYMNLFLSDVALRESCYNCNFKVGNKYSDITLGDFWGVQNYYPEMYNKKGVSAIIINTELGKEAFNSIKNNIEYKSCKLDEIIAGNPSLKFSGKIPKNREQFFLELDSKSIDYLCSKYKKKSSLIRRMLGKVKRIVKKLINK